MSIKEFNSGIRNAPSKHSALYAFYLLTGASSKSIQLQTEEGESLLAWDVWSP